MSAIVGPSAAALRLLPFRLRRPPPLPSSGRRRAWHDFVLDPGGPFVLLWHRVFLSACLVALFLDPFYFYLLYVGGPGCMRVDYRIGIPITILRTIADMFYLVHLLLKFRIAFVAPSSRVFGRGELVTDHRQIAMRYLKKDFVIDLLATLPIPQATTFLSPSISPIGICLVASRFTDLNGISECTWKSFIIWCLIPAVSSSSANHTNNTLSLLVILQYFPRLFLIFPLNARIVKANGVVARTAFAGAVYNLLLYMLASHGLGALWYVMSMERQNTCWVSECVKENGTMNTPMCDLKFLDCRSLEQPERKAWLQKTKVLDNCDATKNTSTFDFGFFADALTDEIIGATFIEKYLYCLWWGLKALSSYGQNLATSTYTGETLFAMFISILGLVLFAQLIGNMQTYLQSLSVKIEEWRIKRRDLEEWMRHRQLPEDLQERIQQFFQYKWLATRGVDEESILTSLPLDLRREIQRHLCLALVRRVPFFSQMDGQLLDAICERLVSSLSTKDTYIVREGDPVNEMFFIIRGQLESSTTNGGRSGFFNSITLRPGDFCGEELLTWALVPNPSANLPSSTRTVRAVSEVEAFALQAEDLKYVANQFKRLHSKKLQHAFRYYSHQWRTWGACLIQAAWRRHTKRKLARKLAAQESLYYVELAEDLNLGEEDSDAPLLVDYKDGSESSLAENGNNHPHLGATILASKFAKNTKRGVVKRAVSIKMPKLMKPDEPDFSMNNEDGI